MFDKKDIKKVVLTVVAGVILKIFLSNLEGGDSIDLSGSTDSLGIIGDNNEVSQIIDIPKAAVDIEYVIRNKFFGEYTTDFGSVYEDVYKTVFEIKIDSEIAIHKFLVKVQSPNVVAGSLPVANGAKVEDYFVSGDEFWSAVIENAKGSYSLTIYTEGEEVFEDTIFEDSILFSS